MTLHLDRGADQYDGSGGEFGCAPPR